MIDISKKIVVYGSDKIISDFQSLFSNLDFVGALSDDNFEAEVSKYVLENTSAVLIVICLKERNAQLEHTLNKLNIERNAGYLYVSDFYQIYNPIWMERNNRKLCIWGIGNKGSELYEYMKTKGWDNEIACFVDNKDDCKEFNGKKVLKPKTLCECSDYYIIVATQIYQYEIYAQLSDYGYEYQKDYLHCSEVMFDYEAMVSKVFEAEPVSDKVCPRPFGTNDIINDCVYLCCPDFLQIPCGSIDNTPYRYCWNSYIARLLRLSVCNGSYVFCNKGSCDLYDFEAESKKCKIASEVRHFVLEPFQYPKMVMVGIDSSCNLNCPSCRKEIYITKGEERDKGFWRAEYLLENLIPYVDRLWLAGCGEVFFSPIYRKILKDNRCRNRDSICILSNGTLFNESSWNLIRDSYSRIDVLVSMDGINNDTIEKLRRGANAEALKNNIRFLGQLRKDEKIENLVLNCVIQSDNVAELQGLVEFCMQNCFDRVEFLRLQNHFESMDIDYQDKTVFDDSGHVKEEYERYFTDELINNTIVDWFNISKEFGVCEHKRFSDYDLV